jgi:hypothetical protein
MAAKKPFRALAGFGKRIEFWLLGEMIRYGLDMYVPLVDDKGIDAIVRKRDGTFVELQIKARSVNVKPGTETLFTVRHWSFRPNFWFVFYSEGRNKTWIMNSDEFAKEASQTKSGTFKGLWWIKFDTKRKRGVSRAGFAGLDRYLVEDFSKIEPKQPMLSSSLIEE